MAKIPSTVSFVTVSNVNPTVLLPPNPARRAIIISGNPGAHVTVTTEPTLVVNEGLVIPMGSPPLTLTRELHGELVARGWTAIASVDATKVGVACVYE